MRPNRANTYKHWPSCVCFRTSFLILSIYFCDIVSLHRSTLKTSTLQNTHSSAEWFKNNKQTYMLQMGDQKYYFNQLNDRCQLILKVQGWKLLKCISESRCMFHKTSDRKPICSLVIFFDAAYSKSSFSRALKAMSRFIDCVTLINS